MVKKCSCIHGVRTIFAKNNSNNFKLRFDIPMDGCFLKKLVAIVFLIFPIFVAQAQVSITSEQNLPIVGDKLYLHAVDGVYGGSNGVNVLWDFSDCEIHDKTTVKRYATDSLGYRSIEPGMRKFYFTSGDTLFLRAYHSSMESLQYAHPQVVMIYPFSYGDSISCPFSGKGTFYETYKLSHDGTKKVMADAIGNILLPENRMLRDVLRVHSLSLVNKWQEGLDPNLVDTAKAKQEVIEEYFWFVKGCRYPVFEYHIGTSYSDGVQVASESAGYCFLPDSVMSMTVPLVGETALNHKKLDSSSGTSGNGKVENLIDYTMSQSDGVLRLSYSTKTDATVTFVIASTMGMVYQSKTCNSTPGVEHQVVFNCSGYKTGGYIVYINVNGVVTSEKFQIK